MEDPFAVLGVSPGATPEELAAAYRDLAKRHHPDVATDDGKRMRAINVAYDSLRNAPARQPRAAAAPDRQRERSRHRSVFQPGSWLSGDVRRQLGRELLEALAPGEDVLVVAEASTWDSPNVRLAVTDRRLLWLRDDAPVARVRFLRYSVLESIEDRVNRRRQGELRVKPRDARTISFAAMKPEALQAALHEIRPRLRQPQSAAS